MGNNSKVNYWFLKTNPEYWDLATLPVGSTKEFTVKNEKNNYRKYKTNFENAKVGDKVIGYVSRTAKMITSLLMVSKALDDGIIEFKMLKQLVTPVDDSDIFDLPELAEAQFVKVRLGTLFKVNSNEASCIMSIIQEKNQSDDELQEYIFGDWSNFKANKVPDDLISYGQVLESKMNVILQGAPGTGKTYSTASMALYIIGKAEPEAIYGLDFNDHAKVMKKYEQYRKNNQIAFCTFHQSMDYEDFVVGLRPEPISNGKAVKYIVKPGIFKQICDAAKQSMIKGENKNFVLIIDEINRGNVSRILGELITLLEKDKRIGCENSNHSIMVKLPYSDDETVDFGVPSNLYIIGTMNTTDRSTGSLDYALRRRFAFITLKADSDKLNPEVTEAKTLFTNIEDFIEKYKYDDMDTSDLMVGHSYFMVSNTEELKIKMEFEVIPLIKEYINDGILKCSFEKAKVYFDDWKNLKAHSIEDSTAE